MKARYEIRFQEIRYIFKIDMRIHTLSLRRHHHIYDQELLIYIRIKNYFEFVQFLNNSFHIQEESEKLDDQWNDIDMKKLMNTRIFFNLNIFISRRKIIERNDIKLN